ncbi:KilA-N domain-containing protein [Salmonella enterica]|nr:phage antirepressor Ant [Salmonella enterica]EIU1720173.1 KilA-N domain-containing protein [Salmonella enterica]EKD9219487.1 KilA-N domain-containing protein [Salmonella enterica]EKI6026260.1 KilA-N domain-containing protein [Salmonella enterica]ELS1743920.1 KilA-N domain-containing protein [Salmonella enterica]
MTSLAKSTVNCTNGIIISDIKIHMDSDGRYSLNDLHKAAGKEHRHLPNYWLDLQQTKELIEEILNTGNPVFKKDGVLNAHICVFKPVASKKGRYGGTYVCKELVYSYAMWISAAFALKVIRAYDSLVSGVMMDTQPQPKAIANKTSVEERTPLRDAVNMLVSKKKVKYPDAYNMINQRFNVESITELEPDQINEAIEYAHRLVLEGEFLGKQHDMPAVNKQFSDEEVCSLAWLWLTADKMRQHAESTYPALRDLGSKYAGEAHDIAKEFNYWLRQVMEMLVRESAHITATNTKAPCMDALMHVRNHKWNSPLLPRH